MWPRNVGKTKIEIAVVWAVATAGPALEEPAVGYSLTEVAC